MKKITIGLLMVLLGVYTASARHINSVEALSVASEFMNSSELNSVKSINSELSPMKAPGVNTDGASPYYVFNRGENDGFVIISGDDRAPKILGYSDKGSFDSENIPPQLKTMMERWATYITNLPETALKHASWSKVQAIRSGNSVLMETADWGQFTPFNDLCPEIDGQKAPSGCVATAMAIAMKYHNWPDCTRGGIEYDYYFPDETFDFDSYAIDWKALSDKNNPDFAKQVAKLTYSAGIAAQMVYRAEESGADVFAVSQAFNRFYAYDKDCQFITRDKFEENRWVSMLRQQLEEVGPVVYSGTGSGGHCFVIDGYNEEGLYHVNWGWDGGSNGYFTLDFALDNGMSFGEYQGMIINMAPDKEKKEYSKAWFPNADVFIDSLNGSNGWNFWNPDVVEGVPNTIKSPNLCIGDFRGYVRLAIADEDDRIVTFTDYVTHLDGYRYYCPHPGTQLKIDNMVLPPLQKGQRYQFYSQEVPNEFEGPNGVETGYYPAYPPSENPEDWKMVLGGIVQPSYFYANGNPSRISEVKVHLPENLPLYNSELVTFDKEFTIKRLRGEDCPLHIIVPRKGIKLEITSSEKDGTPLDVLYVGEKEEYEDNMMSLNISMYADLFDVYVSYEEDGNTRRDSGLSKDKIVENDGLVYKKVSNGLELIGYDKVGETVIIPESILVDGSEMPVISISDMALAFSPIKHLVINPKTLEIAGFVFAGTKQMESVSVKDLSILSEPYGKLIFGDSSLKTVFLDYVPKDSKIFVLAMGYEYAFLSDDWTSIANVKDLDYIISRLPENGYDGDYFTGLHMLRSIPGIESLESVFNSYLIPGLGKTSVLLEKDQLPFPINQMWVYEIDKQNKLVLIKDPLSNVIIDKVTINGELVKANIDGLYEIPTSDNESPDIIVEYTVNGFKKMTTHYTPAYNSTVDNTRLKPLVGGDSNGDGIVTVADAVNAANYIVGLSTTDFDFECADVNGDGAITISDVTCAIAMIPLQNYEKSLRGERECMKESNSGWLFASSKMESSSELYLKSDESITAVQFDITISDGMRMPSITLAENINSTHSLQQFALNTNTIRVVVYSADGKLICNNMKEPFISIESEETGNKLSIGNVYASGTRGQSITLGCEEINVGNGVSGSSIAVPAVRYTKGMLIVENAAGLPIGVYSLDGVRVGKYQTSEEIIEISLSKGIYIVTIGDSSHRVLIR